ncbi:MAG TPA: hypothetical protein VHE55_06735 [Fimbriimonadaceae bacterium]|nr:hypothetical protein [Fimbriimonadaceae bacterium]
MGERLVIQLTFENQPIPRHDRMQAMRMLRSARQARKQAVFLSRAGLLLTIQGDFRGARRCLQSAKRMHQIYTNVRHVAGAILRAADPARELREGFYLG